MIHFLKDDYNILGIVGVIFVLYAYFLLQIGRMKSTEIKYSFINAVGSVLILISLFYTFNLASFVIEVAWLFISIYGTLKAVHLHYKKR